MKNWIGLDIGGTKVLGILYDEKGQAIERFKKKSKASEGLDVVINQVYKVIDFLMAVAGESEVSGIGVGVPGLVSDGGVVMMSPNLPFKDLDLKSLLASKYKKSICVGNDVNVAMFGEFKALNNPTVKNMLGLFIGTGVGGAIVIEGKLYLGQGSAAEFGHMNVQRDGAPCGCGNTGCLEAYASKTAITNYMAQRVKKGQDSCLKEVLEKPGALLKSSELKKAYDEGDDLTVEAVQRAILALGASLGTLINVFHPEQIIFGGGLTEAFGEAFVRDIKRAAKAYAMPGLLESVGFHLSHLGDEAGTYGAFQLIKAQT